MKAVILSGGKGTRLQPLTYTRAKPMIPFLNKPALEHIITKLSKQGFNEIILTTNYRVEQITGYFGDGSKWGVKMRVVHEDEPLGTAGSVKNAAEHLDETFAVVQGDNISEIDVRELYHEHKKKDAMVTISLREVEDVSHFGIVEMSGDRIIRFKEKPKRSETFSKLANAGIYMLEPEVLDMIPLSFYDFSKNLFPKMLEQGKKICGIVSHDFWRDIGRPEDYLEATHHFLGKQNLIDKNCKISSSEMTESVVGKGCAIDGASVRGSVMFENTKIGRGSKLKDCIIGSDCMVGENVDIWPGAVIGDNVRIGNNAVLKGNARIGPNIDVDPGAVCNGVMVPEGLKDFE